MGRRTVLMIVAVIIAALGATLVFLYVQGINDRAVADQEPVQVLTATELIAAGEKLDEAVAAGKIQLSEVPKANVLPNSLTTTDAIKGMVALTSIFPAEQILLDRFGAPGTQQFLTIPEGQMAISVQLTDPARVAGFVTPGSKVAVFLSAEPELINPKPGESAKLPQFTRLLMPSLEVIATGGTTVLTTTTTDATGAQTTEQLPKAILTLAVTQAQAERVIHASKHGELSFGLLTEDSIVRPGPGVTANNLFSE
jgi:pilus assembly protein CpaB